MILFEFLQTFFRDATRKLDIIGPSFPCANVCNAQELYDKIVTESMRFFHQCGLFVIGLMGDCCGGKKINFILYCFRELFRFI